MTIESPAPNRKAKMPDTQPSLANAEGRRVTLRSVDGRVTTECDEEIAAVLIASGKYVPVEPNPDAGAS